MYDVETGGSDTTNAGAFDGSQNAGMLTDGAATLGTGNSPVFTSASYNFVAGDVGAWIYIYSGTHWQPGFYKIASVAANAATLTATVGTVIITAPYGTTTSVKYPQGLNATAGCSSDATATLSGATWSIDYSKQTSPGFTYTDLASVGSGLLVSSVAKPFGKQMVGNMLVITGGTNFNTGRYVIASVSVGLVATVVGAGNITSAAGVSGTGSQGGCLATPGQAVLTQVTGNLIFVQTGTYNITTTLSFTGTGTGIIGYQTYWTDLDFTSGANAYANHPNIVVNNVAIIGVTTGNPGIIRNLVIDAGSGGTKGTTGVGGGSPTNGFVVSNCKITGAWSTAGITLGTRSQANRCLITGCAVAACSSANGSFIDCVVRANTCTGMALSANAAAIRCVVDSNSGASSDGISITGGAIVDSCDIYNNGRDGIRVATAPSVVKNNIITNNAGFGINNTTLFNPPSYDYSYNFFYNNTSGPRNNCWAQTGDVALSGDPYNNAASQDFSLNNTAGAGASVRGAGYPGTYSGIGTTGYKDGGPVQHADPASNSPNFGIRTGGRI